ncbi:hypothetical protein [Phenylobacterium sp.]|uniref:hypothetical protein n=1 Tax=Phenylobacterium sp. TaxID=1871053 RepID=UPI002FD89A97
MNSDDEGLEGAVEGGSDLALDRFVFSQGLDVVLNSASQLASVFGGDLVRALVFFAIVRASVAHLNSRGALNEHAQEGLFPDSLRRPVSILGVSQFLSIPYETTRRHVLALVEDGLCRRLSSRQFIVDSATLARPEITGLSVHMARQLRQLARRIESAAKASGAD